MAASEDPEVDLITVGKPVDDSKAVWDQHPSHPANYEQPAGEVFISDMRPYKVYRSAGIQQKLGEKPPALRELRDQDASKRLEAHDKVVEEREKARMERLESNQDRMIPEGATYIAPPVGVVGPQEAPEGEAEAAEQMAEERQSGQMRRPAGRSGSGSGSSSAPTPGPAPTTSPSGTSNR
jgi:hypothetical protein